MSPTNRAARSSAKLVANGESGGPPSVSGEPAEAASKRPASGDRPRYWRQGLDVEARRIAMVVYPGITALDTVGPLEVFATANLIASLIGRKPLYDLQVIASHDRPVATSVGMSVNPSCKLEELVLPLDTLLVSGGLGQEEACKDAHLLQFLRSASRRVRRLGSICTGAFPLAEAGLLDGKRATTHWALARDLEKRYPKVTVQVDRIFIRDGNVYTSAGVTAGNDLALALIEEDQGRAFALRCARSMVVPFKRAGGQAQFSLQLQAQFASTPAVQRVQEWAAENISGDLSVTTLAARAGMSERNFARLFREATGMTPAEFVERLRVDAARRLLENPAQRRECIATECGFGSADTLRRVFQKRVGVTPSQYRDRFSTA
ncbi:transcriptional regulator, AraC family with amidase-like domain [Rhizobiales bacterium GAS113]|nr:transcriptional regulator, AraC family with amidase-like domain [Rhizobiales bacterium GAS113]